jgi:hypothetical protein
MDKNSICTVLCAAALFSAASAGPAHAAGLTLGDLQGAWLGQETGCQTAFAFSGSKPAFKRPADAFVPAFIVSGDKLTTPLASCRIRKMEETEKGTRVTMACANALSSAPVVTRFAFGRGYLLRVSDSGVETGYYNHCKRE